MKQRLIGLLVFLAGMLAACVVGAGVYLVYTRISNPISLAGAGYLLLVAGVISVGMIIVGILLILGEG